MGLGLTADGIVQGSVVGGPAFKAGIHPGVKVVAVDGRAYTHDRLEDAIKSSPGGSQPIALLVVNDDYYEILRGRCHSGERYPHLERDAGRPDYLDQLINRGIQLSLAILPIALLQGTLDLLILRTLWTTARPPMDSRARGHVQHSNQSRSHPGGGGGLGEAGSNLARGGGPSGALDFRDRVIDVVRVHEPEPEMRHPANLAGRAR